MSVPFRGLILLLAALSGCTGFAGKRQTEDPWVNYAEMRIQDGDYNGAARIFSDMAAKSGKPDYYRLRGADAYLRGGNSSAAQALMSSVDPGELGDSDRVDYYLLSARLNLNVGRAKQAMALLDRVARSQRDDTQELHYHLLRASGYNQLGRMLDSARERIAVGPSLRTADAIAKNDSAIFDALNRLPDATLERQAPPPPDPLGGWMQLAHILRTAPATELGTQLGDWRERFPNHPADGAFLDEVLRESGRHVEIRPTAKPRPLPATVAEPRNTEHTPGSGHFLGVALPLTGSYAPAGEAIRAGMLAAFYADDTAGKSAMRFTDTQTGNVEAIYKDFAQQGATLAVGPLLKEDVARVIQVPDRPIPVLALNQVSNRTDPGVFQFGLTPEQEVEQAAGAAWFDGRHDAAVLTPTSAFGERLAAHFTRYWRNLGGRIIAAKTYAPNGADFTRPAQELGSLLGSPASGDPSANPAPRADFLFLIANSHDARLIKPQLDAAGFAGIPVYATSHVYSGRADPPQDRNLDGIYFCDIPWLIHPNQGGSLSSSALKGEIDKTSPDFVKLIALGIDAYRLAKDISALGNRFTGYLFDGATGMLTLQNGNRVQRQLECAQFEGGQPQPRGLAPILRPSESNTP